MMLFIRSDESFLVLWRALGDARGYNHLVIGKLAVGSSIFIIPTRMVLLPITTT